MGIERFSKYIAPHGGKEHSLFASNKYLSRTGEFKLIAKKDGNALLAWFRGRSAKHKLAVDFVKRLVDRTLGEGAGARILEKIEIKNRMTGEDLWRVVEEVAEA